MRISYNDVANTTSLYANIVEISLEEVGPVSLLVSVRQVQLSFDQYVRLTDPRMRSSCEDGTKDGFDTPVPLLPSRRKAFMFRRA
jgi:hypothetical protein